MVVLGCLYATCAIVCREHLKLFVSQQYLEKQDIADYVVNHKNFVIAAVYSGFKIITKVHKVVFFT